MQEFELFRWSARDWKTGSCLKEQAGTTSAARVQSGTVPRIATARPAANRIGARSLHIPCAGSFADGPHFDAVAAVGGGIRYIASESPLLQDALRSGGDSRAGPRRHGCKNAWSRKLD